MTDTLPAGSSAGLLESLAGFVTELRKAGIPVSLTENLDAVEALRHVPLEDREAFKYALAATLVKNNGHWRTFETVLEVYFSLRGRDYRIGGDGAADGGPPVDDLVSELLGEQPGDGDGQGQTEGLTPEQLAEMLFKALMNRNEAMLRALARAAVTRFAGMEPGRPVGGTYYLYRTLRQLDLDSLLQRMLAEHQPEHQPDGDQPGSDRPIGDLEDRLIREEFESRLEKLRREIEAEIRRRLVA